MWIGFLSAPFLLLGDVVTDWNAEMLAAIRLENTAPPLAARDLAMLHIGIFEAINDRWRQ